MELVLKSRLSGFISPHFSIASLRVQGQSYLTKIYSSKMNFLGSKDKSCIVSDGACKKVKTSKVLK